MAIRSNRRLREEALAIFEQTFAITRLLRHMSLVIAVCGVALSLVVLARERAAELALYRALGAQRGQLFRVYLGKGMGMGMSGIALGTLAGIGFALILIYVVNRAFFGWTIAVHWPVGLLASQNGIVVLAAARGEPLSRVGRERHAGDGASTRGSMRAALLALSLAGRCWTNGKWLDRITNGLSRGITGRTKDTGPSGGISPGISESDSRTSSRSSASEFCRERPDLPSSVGDGESRHGPCGAHRPARPSAIVQ